MPDSVGGGGTQIVSVGSGAAIFADASYFHTFQPAVTLSASSLKAASAAGADVQSDYIKNAHQLAFVLDVTASNTPTTLDVAIEAKYGSVYGILARFTQVGAVATSTGLIMVTSEAALATQQTLAAAPAVGTGLLVNHGMAWLDTLRIAYTIVGTSYTFSVVAYPMN